MKPGHSVVNVNICCMTRRVDKCLKANREPRRSTKMARVVRMGRKKGEINSEC